jgi:hypothetical protein
MILPAAALAAELLVDAVAVLDVDDVAAVTMGFEKVYEVSDVVSIT